MVKFFYFSYKEINFNVVNEGYFIYSNNVEVTDSTIDVESESIDK